MASSFDEQPAAGMGRRKEGARRAQTHRPDDEGAPRGAEYPGNPGNARGSGRYQESPARRVDVLWTLGWPDWNHGGDGGISIRKEEGRWADQGYGE